MKSTHQVSKPHYYHERLSHGEVVAQSKAIIFAGADFITILLFHFVRSDSSRKRELLTPSIVKDYGSAIYSSHLVQS